MHMFTQQEIDELSALHFINQIDAHLRVVSKIRIAADTGDHPPRVILLLELLYDKSRVDKLSFDLHNHSYADIIEVARNVGDNEYLMCEIDNLLSGHGE
ncbi:hypothetical protein BJI67_02285 [Acidihalobacter aeolianus]|uniref:Uncharacterized protein n=1 Tax=Acidihalobacter aeolianus TaxID=2792603 RepID=A0A1D8K517_9GAMM|nr:hypothetical protein [Acidihalobacter aeolianus]AOV16053.1 hypothetical protein BJI67_02285 [Acidihalobacter aeolianus]